MTVLAGAAISLLLFAIASWHNPLLLKIIVGVWVIAPFFGAAVLKRMFPPSRRAIDRALVAATMISAVVYCISILMEPGWKPAAPFVVVPIAIWALLVAATLIGR